jgi:glyoxylase-like metal-dependent hydrolase (beta-lactamase superfamily II)
MQEERYEDVRILKGRVEVKGIGLQIYLYHLDSALIDTGPAALFRDIARWLSDIPTEAAFITHLHEDHCGNAAAISQMFHIPLFLHEMSLEKAAAPMHIPLYRRLFWGQPAPFLAKPYPQSVTLKQSDFLVIETPGHSEDHIALYDKNRGYLFSGDLFITPKVKICMRQESMPDLISSLRRVLKYDFDTVFCAHAGVIPNGKQALAQKLAYLEELQQTVNDLHQKGMNLRQICRTLFPKRPPIYYLSLGEWSPIHLVRSLLTCDKT